MKEWDSQLATHSDKKLSCNTTFKQNFGQEKYFMLLKKEVIHVFTYLSTVLI